MICTINVFQQKLYTQVDKLRAQANEQAEVISSQEAELSSKKEQLEGLKKEEQHLEQLRSQNVNKLETLTVTLQETQLGISQVLLCKCTLDKII